MSKRKDDNCDQQREEINIISSIYISEIEFTRQTAPYKITIQLKPFLEHWVTEDMESFTLSLDVEFPKHYPNECPKCELLPHRNTIAKNHIATMYRLIEEIYKVNKGTPMIFEIVESLRTWIQNNLIAPELRPKKMKRKNINDDLGLDVDDGIDEIIINLTKKETYTPVTRETFLTWKKRFDQEMADLRKLKGELLIEDTRPTGKQLFERDKSLANSDLLTKEEEDEDEVVAYDKKEETKQPENSNELFCYDNELFEGDEILFDPDN